MSACTSIRQLYAAEWRSAWHRAHATRPPPDALEKAIQQFADDNPQAPTTQAPATRVDDLTSPSFSTTLQEAATAHASGSLLSCDGQRRGWELLAMAAIRASTYLDLSDKARSRLLPPTEIASGQLDRPSTALETDFRLFESALHLIRVFKALHALISDRAAAAQWLRMPNTALDAPPATALEEGRIEQVLAYLENALSH